VQLVTFFGSDFTGAERKTVDVGHNLLLDPALCAIECAIDIKHNDVSAGFECFLDTVVAACLRLAPTTQVHASAMPERANPMRGHLQSSRCHVAAGLRSQVCASATRENKSGNRAVVTHNKRGGP